MRKSEGGRDYESYPNGRRDPQRDRDRRDHRDDRRYREERDARHDRGKRERDYSDRTRDTPTYITPTEESYTPAPMPPTELDRYEPKEALYNFRYVLTSRGLCQLMCFFVNLLIVICAGVSHGSSGGYRNLASLGGVYAYHFGGASAFTGAEADRVQELDALFYQLKLPPYIFSMACGGALMAYSLAMLLLGVFRVPFRWPGVLLVEGAVSGLISLGYIPALAFYFIKIQENYDSPICKEREELYKSKGHEGFECSLHGADIAGGLFGVLGVIAFALSAVLAFRAFRTMRERNRRKAQQNI